jgi:hypothetical protein
VPKDAIVIVGDADNLSDGEADLLNRLERKLLFNLVSIADDDDLARDFDPGLVIICTSVNANTLQDEWANERAPIIVMNFDVLPFMEMAGAHGVLDVVEAEIVEPDHPIVKGLDDDRLLLMNARFAEPARSATIVVSALGNRRRALIFAYEFGDTLAEIGNEEPRTARHRRVGFYASTDDVPDPLSEEEILLDNALLWTWSGGTDNR